VCWQKVKKFKILIGLTICCTIVLSCDKNPVGPGEIVNQWVSINSGLNSLYVQYIAVNPHNDNILYAATYGSIYKSTDKGTQWSEAGTGLTSDDIKCVEVSLHDSNVLFCGTWGHGIFKSLDGGTTWESKSEGIPNPRINEIEFDPLNSDNVYAACADQMFVTNNGGDNWNSCFTYGNVRSIAVHPQQSEILFVGLEYHGAFKSVNGGLDWLKVNEGLANTADGYAGPYDIAINPLTPDLMYAATYATDLFKSENGGASWELKNNGLDYRKVRNIALDPSNPNILYAATDRGVMYSTDTGETWHTLNNGLSEDNIRTIAVGNGNPRMIYIGTYGGGIYRYVWGD